MNYDEQNEEKKAIEERNRRRRDRELNDLKKVLAIVEGRRLLWRIMALAGTFRGSFNPNALQMAFNEGNRNIGNTIFDDIMVSAPEYFTRMQREYVSDQKSERSKDVKE